MDNMGIDPITATAVAGPAAQGVSSLIDSIVGIFRPPKDNTAAAIKLQQMQATSQAVSETTRNQLIITTLVGAGALMVGGMLLYGAMRGGKTRVMRARARSSTRRWRR